MSGRRDESKLAWVTIAVGIGSVAIDGRHKQWSVCVMVKKQEGRVEVCFWTVSQWSKLTLAAKCQQTFGLQTRCRAMTAE